MYTFLISPLLVVLWAIKVTSQGSNQCYEFVPVDQQKPSLPPLSDVHDACARISNQTYGVDGPSINAQEAYDCLNSVPIHKTEAIELVKSLQSYIQFQTTLKFLERPPSTYRAQCTDIITHLAAIQSRLEQGLYDREYSYQTDIYNVISSALDGHFSYHPDLFAGVFSFYRPVSLISYSSDGVSAPQLYVYDSSVPSESQSPVIEINDKPIEQALNGLMQNIFSQDRDARYNILLFNQPQQSLGAGSSLLPFFSNGSGYPGPTTKLRFRNGTTYNSSNMATLVGGAFEGIKSGEDVYQRFCVGKNYTSTWERLLEIPNYQLDVPSQPGRNDSPRGYPENMKLHWAHLVGGYYLDRYPETAVLSVPSFALHPRGPEDLVEFQTVVREFLAKCTTDRKQKLIIDLRGNAGGIPYMAFDLFKQLFPNTAPVSVTRLRAPQVLNKMGQDISDSLRNVTPSNVLNITNRDRDRDLAKLYIYETTLNYKNPLWLAGISSGTSRDNSTFKNWHELYGPYSKWSRAQGGIKDNFTSLVGLDLGSSLRDLTGYYFINSTLQPGFILSGYGSEELAEQPFATENITLLYNGFCASTCATFSELLHPFKIKTIVVGGYPEPGPMQAVGCTKGAQSLSLSTLHNYAKGTYDLASAAQKRQLLADADFHNLYEGVALNRGTGGSINYRDNIRAGDKTETPLQFIYEAADCRIWYTKPMINNATNVWEKVAAMPSPSDEAAWENYCIAGQAVPKQGPGNETRGT